MQYILYIPKKFVESRAHYFVLSLDSFKVYCTVDPAKFTNMTGARVSHVQASCSHYHCCCLHDGTLYNANIASSLPTFVFHIDTRCPALFVSSPALISDKADSPSTAAQVHSLRRLLELQLTQSLRANICNSFSSEMTCCSETRAFAVVNG